MFDLLIAGDTTDANSLAITTLIAAIIIVVLLILFLIRRMKK